MKINAFPIIIITIAFHINSPSIIAQVKESKTRQERKEERKAKEARSFSRIDSLVTNQQFVFQPKNNQGLYSTFVVVDSVLAEVQNGNRNNLIGHITEYEIKRNDKKNNLTVSIKMRGEIQIADIFLLISSSGFGKATIKSDATGDFSFSGYAVDFDSASIYEGRSHYVQ